MNSALFFFGILLCLGFIYIVVQGLLKKFHESSKRKATHWFSLIGFSYILVLIFSFSWIFGNLDFSSRDFAFIYSIGILLQTLIFMRVKYLIKPLKSEALILLLYLIPVFAIFFPFRYFPLILLVISFFILFRMSFSFFGSFSSRRMAYWGMGYSAASLLLSFIGFFDFFNSYFIFLIGAPLFIGFSYYFVKDLDKLSAHSSSKIVAHGEHNFVLFARYFIFIIVVTNLILVSTLGFHELSHVLASRYFGCESRSIFYEQGSYPYSESLCDDDSNIAWIIAAGPVLTSLVAIVLLLIGGRYTRAFALLILGFNFLASYIDLQQVGFSNNISVLSSILGVAMIIIGIFLLAKSRIKEHDPGMF